MSNQGLRCANEDWCLRIMGTGIRGIRAVCILKMPLILFQSVANLYVLLRFCQLALADFKRDDVCLTYKPSAAPP